MAALNKFKKLITEEEIDEEEDVEEEEKGGKGKNGKMILLEPRAYSESQQIADHLKQKNTVVVNMKRVTADQAKRIVDFLSGTVYAIGGDLQKIGAGIFLCTPRNVNVEGSITEEEDKKNKKNDIELDWQVRALKGFSVVNNGYDINEVNEFIDVVIKRLEELDNQVKKYQNEVVYLNSLLSKKKEENDKIIKTLIAVEDTSNKIKRLAKEEADMIVEEARRNANAIIHEALLNASEKDKEALILEKNITIYKARVKSLLEAQLKLTEDMEKIEFSVDK